MDLLQICVTLFFLISTGHVECQIISPPAHECFNNTTCPCCSVPCPSDGSGLCGGNCIDGYFGGKCWNRCPVNCRRCVDAQQGGGVSNCTLCKDGYYSTESMYQCQLTCSRNCKTCELSSVYCTSCQDGYYLTMSNTCERCNDTCMTCYSQINCTSCYVGFFLDVDIAHCQKCNPLCFSCDSAHTCYCSNGCAVTCDTETNLCNYGCKQHFASTDYGSSKCDKCVDGSYGYECDLQCSATCKSGRCERISGHCFECLDRRFGDNCNLSCPKNCETSCDKITGQCHSCRNGFFGINCTQQCPINCITCKTENGSCTSCDAGLYGSYCEKSCPEKCQERKCDKTDGSCKCVFGFTGLHCEIGITTATSTIGHGPPLVMPAAPQNYVGATVGITLAAVVFLASLLGVGVRCCNRKQVTRKENITIFNITTNMSDIEKLEKELSCVEQQLTKLTARKSEILTELEGLKIKIPYHHTDQADKVADDSYELLQVADHESQYSTLQ